MEIFLAQSVSEWAKRFRHEADALAAGERDPMRLRGDELDPIALAFNDYQAKLLALEAKQVKEEELVAARRYADNVIKSMFDILIVTDADMRIQTANQAACDLLEYAELELVGRPIESVFKEEPTFLGMPIREVLQSNQMRDFEATYLTNSGRLVPVLLSASTMRDNAGRPLAYITVAKDITARKQMERELLDAKATAEAASAAGQKSRIRREYESRNPHADDRNPRLCESP